jgi:hypothetical protein
MEEEASSAEAACALAPFDTSTEDVLIAWLKLLRAQYRGFPSPYA